MIIAYTGMPGSGKSLGVSHMAMKEMKKGRKVFTNYYLKGAYQVSFDDLINHTFPPGAMLIIDEAGQWFNSRNWSQLPMEVFQLFTLHRHMGLDLVVAVQNFNRIDKALREVIELVYWADNRGFLPFIIYRGYYDVERLGAKGESDVIHYVPKWTRAKKLYDTHSEKNKMDKDVIPLVPWAPTVEKRGLVKWLKGWRSKGDTLDQESDQVQDQEDDTSLHH